MSIRKGKKVCAISPKDMGMARDLSQPGDQGTEPRITLTVIGLSTEELFLLTVCKFPASLTSPETVVQTRVSLLPFRSCRTKLPPMASSAWTVQRFFAVSSDSRRVVARV
jgi:hypothetical protein